MGQHPWASIEPTLAADQFRHNDAHSKRRTNVDLKLGHRLRRWPNIKSTLDPVSTGRVRIVIVSTRSVTSQSVSVTCPLRHR